MDNPVRSYYENGNILNERWYENGKQHRLDGPAEIWYFKNGNIEAEEWYENDQYHRLDGPADIVYDENGNIQIDYWYINGKPIVPLYDNYPLTEEQIIEMKLTYG